VVIQFYRKFGGLYRAPVLVPLINRREVGTAAIVVTSSRLDHIAAARSQYAERLAVQEPVRR
jgi:hypothetical protein